ncbi:MAG: hypothetical protein J6K45_05295 [Clostridia bacterium]|nr:hypothetical protein [Clostridia bacterium]
MQSCLGVYIENKLIKYAKVSRDRDSIKIESFGTKFYEDLKQAISQIAQETNSAKTPISVNLDGEYYDYFDFFSLLSKNDLKKSTEIEFEMLCREKNMRKEDMDKRYIFVLDPDKENRMKAINVSIEKEKIEERKDLFDGYNLTAIEPLPIGIANLVKTGDVECELIVNMEEKTTLTFLQDDQIDLLQEIDSSISEALREISKRENSYSKAYEILKNITITSQDINAVQYGNEYIDVVIPVLFKILTEIKEKIAEYGKQINKIYFTGTGAIINNIDMYFQDRMNDIQCDIVKPSFLEAQSLKIGIKDYIEVNSAISLAMSGMGTGATNELNFSGKSAISKVGIEMPGLPGNKKMPEIKTLKESAEEPLDAYERTVVRIIAMCLVFIIGYSICGKTLYNNMDEKKKEAIQKQDATTTAISNMSKTKISIDNLNSEYQSIIAKLNNQSVENGEVIFENWEIANFLTHIASVIPTEVKLISIENTTGRHFVIQARSIKYQQLGYFKALLEANAYLENVTASTGIRASSSIESSLSPDVGTAEEYIVVTIEGDLV